MQHPHILKGDRAIDERGIVSFVNQFGFESVKRFYILQNHEEYFIRAWQGHRNEAKYFTVVQGKALICAVKIDDWDNPSRTLLPDEFILSAQEPAVLCVPEGYANGVMNFSTDTKIMIFATTVLAETKSDDVRWQPAYWDPWSKYNT